jgi:hypothetical protein
MTRKTLGRCARRHTQVVEYDDAALPSGTCKAMDKQTGQQCAEPLIEWALNHGAPAKESTR